MLVTRSGDIVHLDSEDEAVLSSYALYSVRAKRAGVKRTVAVAAYKPGKGSCPLTHIILDVPTGKVVDHIDGDGLNNRKSNLRVCTVAENTRNTKPRFGCKRPLKGIYFRIDKRKPQLKAVQRWRARIMVNGERVSLGSFVTPDLAHAAFKAAATRLHGSFARTE